MTTNDAREALIETIAQFLHDEGGFGDAYPDHSWPEHPDDTGQREGGWVKLVPIDAQAQFRDVARRLATMLPAPAPAQEAVEAVAKAIAGQRAIRMIEANGGDPTRIKAWNVDARDRQDAAAAIAALSTPPEPASDPCKLAAGEAVAWKYTDADGVEFSDMKWPAGVVVAQGWTETPLYATPQPPEQCANIAQKSEEEPELIERLLDAQQDINFAANTTMDHSLCNASALIDEIEPILRAALAQQGSATSGDAVVAVIERAQQIIPEYQVNWHAAAYQALSGIDDDYMTSEKHHPGYVLIPTAKFEQLCAVLRPTRGEG